MLIKDGHIITDVGSAEEALAVLESFDCETAIVDIRMPGMSGIELLEAVRARWPHISVIVLTGHGTLVSAMAAVKAGAHDYLLKPAQPGTIRQTLAEALAVSRRRREQDHLLESLRASLERLNDLPASHAAETRSAMDTRQLKVGDLLIDFRSHEVHREGGVPIPLSPSEFKLLAALASRLGEVIEYVALVRLGLGYDADSLEARELIKRHVFELRQKIEPDPASPQYILNVRGVGYRLAPSQSQPITIPW